MTQTGRVSHAAEVTDGRVAVAPYNFVPLPSKVVQAEAAVQKSAQHGAYLHDEATGRERRTGTIACELRAESPLYVRGALSPEQLATFGGGRYKDLSPEQRRIYAQFFHSTSESDSYIPLIPGSTLRGLLRALVEIAAYGKIDRVTDRQRYFYRAVAAKASDPLGPGYRRQLQPQRVRVGYLVRERDGSWKLRPARRFGQDGYLKVREREVPSSLGLIRFNSAGYKPQEKAVSFTIRTTPAGRQVVDRIALRGELASQQGDTQYDGTLVTSGNMLETLPGQRPAFASPRKNHAVVGLPSNELPLLIEAAAVENYCASLTPFQRGEGLGKSNTDWPFSDRYGLFAHRDGTWAIDRPVFYCEPEQKGQPITLFGHSPNFRVPFRPPGVGRAASPRDFVPLDLRDDQVVDIAEALFGYVRGNRRDEREGQARAGRVSVSDALATSFSWLPGNEVLTPRILATPKATTFQHYLTQPDPTQRQLRHYGSRPSDETTIRGHKLYWHKGEVTRETMEDAAFLSGSKGEADTQHTGIRPVASGSMFSFKIHFENLTDIELGALLWVLRLTEDERYPRPYRLKLGMGKPLGMGAVKLSHTLSLTARQQRYRSLFNAQQDAWVTGEQLPDADLADTCVQAFERYVLTESADPSSDGTLAGTLRIQMLLALLTWPGPAAEQTRYLEIERGSSKVNEYKDRPVLPTPLQVVPPDPSWEPPPSKLEQVAGPLSPLSAQPAPTTAPSPPSAQPAPMPTVGTSFTGKIVRLDESAAIISVPGFPDDQVIALLRSTRMDGKRFREGNTARVEVIEERTLKGGLTVLEVKPAPRASI